MHTGIRWEKLKKGPLERHRHRWEGMDLTEIGCEGMNWIHLAWVRKFCLVLFKK